MLDSADVQHEYRIAAGFRALQEYVVVLVVGDEHGESADSAGVLHGAPHIHVEITLAHCDKCRGIHVVQGDGGAVENRFVRRQLVILHVGVAQEAPLDVPVRVRKGEFTLGSLHEIPLDVVGFVRGSVLAAGEPAVLAELYRGQEYLPAQVVVGAPDVLLAESQG